MANGLNLRQLNEIQRGLDGGMSPDEISNSIGRINDLPVLDVEAIRAAAQDLQHDRQHGVGVLAAAR
jgi:hypothetical protein